MNMKNVLRTLVILGMMIGIGIGISHAQPVGNDKLGEVKASQRALANARRMLEHAGDDWGGHRAAALQQVIAAQKELDQAVIFFRNQQGKH